MIILRKKIFFLLLYIACVFISEVKTAFALENLFLQKADSLLNAGNYEKACSEFENALQSAKEKNDLQQQAFINNKIGKCLSYNGKDFESASFFKKSIQQASTVNDSSTLSDALNNYVIAYEYTGSYDSAFFYYEKALLIREKQNDTTGIAASTRNMAQILRVLNRFDEAVKYCNRAFSLISGINDFKLIANIYNEKAYLFEQNNQLDSAKEYYNKLIDVSIRSNYDQGISVGLSNLATVFEREGNYDEALMLKKRGLETDRANNNIYGIMTSYRTIADCYLLSNNFSFALAYTDSAFQICDSDWISDRQGIEYARYNAYNGLGDCHLALLHFEKATILKDSLLNEQKRKNIAEILTKYETGKKEQQIELLNKTNQLKTEKIKAHRISLFSVILLSLAGAVISFLLLRNRNQRIKQMKLEIQNYLLQLKEGNKHSQTTNETDRNQFQSLAEKFKLTKRETEIMELTLKGFNNNEIAGKLFISENTVKFHLKNIYIKLNVKNRIQALQKSGLS